MLPKTLQHHWQHIQTNIADMFSHHGLDWLGLWESLEHEQQQRLQKVLCLSDYVVDSLSHQGDYFANALRSDSISQPLQRADFSRWLDEFAQNAKTEDDWHVALRHLRRRAMVHIIWCDLLRIANTLDTTRTLSELADECVCRSLEFLATDLHTRHGKPMGKESNTEQQLLVLGMGKLGAYELNLSSDIDLIFTYPESGNTSGPRVISNQEYFVKLGQKLIQALDKQTVDGFVFRTDMRLRPFGDSGPLVMNFASLENYYATQGRDWERYAMVKARVMNGESSPDAKELLSILRPFTYRVYVDFSAFASLRSLKEMINAEVRRRGLENNIKLGAGGIREIEFIVQAFQLIRGGQDRLLQSRGLCRVLDILGAEGYLPLDACQQLRQAYLFLRDSEHAIQALADEQTQQLPDNDLDQARVAWAFGYEEWDSYLTQLTQHRAHVSLHFDHIVADDQDQEKTSDSVALAWIDCWHGELDGDAEIAFLMQFPCDDFDAIKKILTVFRESRAVRSMQAIGHDRLEELMPLLLRQVWQQKAPAIALERLIPLLEAVLRRTAYLVLLKENPQALEQLVRLCSASSWVAQYITDTPLLLDELLNVRNLYRLPTAAELREELHLRLLRIERDDLEQQMEQLRQFVRAHKLRAAACEVMQALTLMQVSDYLTWLAEVTLLKVMNLSWQQMTDKYGFPTDQQGEMVPEPEFIIVGYGKMGGLELSYSSDLDLVFIHNGCANKSTTGERAIENGVFYTRMGQRMVHIMTAQTRSGDLYEVDLRLRPSGSSGMIVASLKAFHEYQQHHAWTWEHQALVRARVICGNADLGDDFSRTRATILSCPKETPELQQEVRAMRQKMRDNLGSKDSSGLQFHLKQDAGGIVDIEFLVQYGVLAWSQQHPQLLAVTDNMRLLDAFADAGLMDPKDCQTLQEIYLAYRAETHRRALQKQSLLLDSDTQSQLGFEQYRNDVTRMWNLWLEY